jgi:4a-hydroxytetrahydrobiopterin dehydratase
MSLAEQHCRPLEGHGAMSAADVQRHLNDAPGWGLVDGSIEKTFRFEDYHRTMAFVNAVAWIAHREDHHPDIAFGYKTCKVTYWTHAIGGLSENDFILAAKIDQLPIELKKS